MRALLVLLLVAGLAVPIAWNGGFSAGAQWAFAGIAAAAALAMPQERSLRVR